MERAAKTIRDPVGALKAASAQVRGEQKKEK
jgi:hypothetical protein